MEIYERFMIEDSVLFEELIRELNEETKNSKKLNDDGN